MNLSKALVATAVLSFTLVLAAWRLPKWWVRAQIRAQRETESNLRTLGIALDAYGKEHRSFPRVTECSGLREALVPRYVKAPTFDRICRDGWENGLVMNYSRSSPTAPADVAASTGRDVAQRETTYSLSALGMAVEAYGKEHGSFPQVTDCSRLREALVPQYVKASSFDLICRDRSSTPTPTFVVASTGRDGSFGQSTRELFRVPGEPLLRASLARELSINGTWYDMDCVWIAPEGFIAVAFDGQDSRFDYGRAPHWTKRVRWLVTSLWAGYVVVVLGLQRKRLLSGASSA